MSHVTVGMHVKGFCAGKNTDVPLANLKIHVVKKIKLSELS